MSGFLDRLAAHAHGGATVLRLRPVSRFERVPEEIGAATAAPGGARPAESRARHDAAPALSPLRSPAPEKPVAHAGDIGQETDEKSHLVVGRAADDPAHRMAPARSEADPEGSGTVPARLTAGPLSSEAVSAGWEAGRVGSEAVSAGREDDQVRAARGSVWPGSVPARPAPASVRPGHVPAAMPGRRMSPPAVFAEPSPGTLPPSASLPSAEPQPGPEPTIAAPEDALTPAARTGYRPPPAPARRRAPVTPAPRDPVEAAPAAVNRQASPVPEIDRTLTTALADAGVLTPEASDVRWPREAVPAAVPDDVHLHIHLDRVDVLHPAPPPAAPPPRRPPSVDHDAYLARRREARR